jgi:hypothetical protein
MIHSATGSYNSDMRETLSPLCAATQFPRSINALQLVPEMDDPIYKGIFFDICLLLFAPHFYIMIDPVQILWSL